MEEGPSYVQYIMCAGVRVPVPPDSFCHQHLWVFSSFLGIFWTGFHMGKTTTQNSIIFALHRKKQKMSTQKTKRKTGVNLIYLHTVN